MNGMISLYQNSIDRFSFKYDALNKAWNDTDVFGMQDLLIKYGFTYNLITGPEAAIGIAEILYREKYPSIYNQYLPFYAIKYKNVWCVYGCKNIKTAITSNWKQIGEWDEIFTVISKDTSEVLLMTMMK